MPTLAQVTVGTTGADYTDLDTALATEARDLVTSDELIEFIILDKLTGQNPVDIDGAWVCDATHYVTIRAADGSGGKDGTTDARIKADLNPGATKACVIGNAAYSDFFDITGVADYCVVKDIYIENSHAWGYRVIDLAYDADNCTLKNLVLKAGANAYNCIQLGDISSKAGFCLAQCDGGEAFDGLTSGHIGTYVNCVAVNSAVGFKCALGGTFINCATYNCTTDYHTPASANAASTNNAGSSANAADIPGANSITSLTSSAFEDVSTDDYRTKSGGALDNAGADASAYFTTDAFENTIVNWPVGLNEPTGGGTSYTLTADSATFNTTAQDAGLNAGRAVIADSATFNTTAQD
ncbi:MAG: hypothetical protein D6711_17010, partial [Chloroflexi bacterium]